MRAGPPLGARPARMAFMCWLVFWGSVCWAADTAIEAWWPWDWKGNRKQVEQREETWRG